MLTMCGGGDTLVCPKCNLNNNGIKLNGKLFCCSCGEVMEDATEILEQSYESSVIPPNPIAYKPSRISKDGETIVPQKPTENNNVFNVKEENEGNSKQISTQNTTAGSDNIENRKVEKNNRERVIIGPSSDYKIFTGEPDPINEPELPAPHDMQVETNKNIDFEKELKYPLLARREQEKIHKDVKNKQANLTNFFKNSIEHTITKKKKKKIGAKTKISIILSIILLAVVLAGAGLVFYVKNYATNPKVITKNIESKTNFIHNSPSYIPAGYEISFESYSSGEEIHYFYVYQPDITKSLSISITTTKFKSDQILETIIKPQAESFKKYPIENLDLWFVGEQKVIFINNGLLYEISTSGKINEAEAIKITKGLI